ncbi:hypothetical protein, partial [Escherichia coli]|uniref:hypothetical protein n=1 Tax=Escherichia coli TaxID=562 RepID=UPI0010CB856B
NVFAIESRWYRDNPLVIRGPGPGRDVTAGPIQSDITRLAPVLSFPKLKKARYTCILVYGF